MVLYHVTNLRLLQKYMESGQIHNPVRAWSSLEGAMRFSKQTDRNIILRLEARKGWRRLGGHQSQAMISDKPFPIEKVRL